MLDTKFIADAKKKSGNKTIYFYTGIVKLYNKEYFTFLDKSDSLTFIDIANQSIHKTNISPILKTIGEYHISQIHGNKMFWLNRETHHFYQYHINKDFSIELEKGLDLNKSGKLTDIGFEVYPDATRFTCHDSLLFINYSIKKGKNFIGKDAIVYINLNNPNLKPTFLIGYPENYQKEEIRNTELLFDMANDTCLTFGYMQHDAIGIYNIKTNIITQTKLNRKNGYLIFDESKHGNLGYTAKYLLINETNYKLFCDSLQRIYLFKKLSKVHKTDPTVMECYIFTSQLTPIQSFRLNEEVCPSFIYKYQKGFLAFTKDLSKAYYYAF